MVHKSGLVVPKSRFTQMKRSKQLCETRSSCQWFHIRLGQLASLSKHEHCKRLLD